MKEKFTFTLAIGIELSCAIAVFAGLLLIALSPQLTTSILIGSVTLIVIGALGLKPADKFRKKAEMAKEYDEFGNSKRKSFKNMSRYEREQIDRQRTLDMERIMSTADLGKRTKKGSADPEKDMDALVGMESVKQKMREMAATMEFNASENKKDKKKAKSNVKTTSGRHMIFDGPPGTGKTTMAEIFTGFLYKYGYIPENKVVEVDGNFMMAQSDTAKKVELVVRHSFGGVLFIDEAYAMADDYVFGKLAIAELIKQMEDNRDRFVLILAGYTTEMQKLLAANPGFQSRFKDFLRFSNYTASELQKIFIYMAGQQGFVISAGAAEAFNERIQREVHRSSFGNARTVRNILTESIDKHAFNYQSKLLDENDKYSLQAMDVPRIPSRTEF